MKFVFSTTLALALLATAPALADEPGKKINAQSQNLYVGANLFQILDPPAGTPFCDDPTSPLYALCIPAAVAGIVQDMIDSDFPARAAEIADQIKRDKPDVIGLQEVSLIRTQSPSDFFTNPTPNAEEVLFDYLQILLDALEAVGEQYEVAGVIEDADVEFPMLVGFADPVTPLFADARLTDHDVILVRKNIEKHVSNVDAAHYSQNLEVTVGGVTVEFTRGYVAVDARIRGVDYRIVNTHLEVQQPDPTNPLSMIFQAAQAYELTGILSDETLPIILMGDFNSSSEDLPVVVPPPLPPGFPPVIVPPYAQLTFAGYTDVWLHRDVPTDGFTCCQRADLLNPVSVLHERVDLIWVRNYLTIPPMSPLGPVEVETVGDLPEDKTPSGLWPSDHAGVVGNLRIPRLD
jgi:exonuclease III